MELVQAMREGWRSEGIRSGVVDIEYFDEQSLNNFDPVLLEIGERAE